jgi:hypothetical protein
VAAIRERRNGFQVEQRNWQSLPYREPPCHDPRSEPVRAFRSRSHPTNEGDRSRATKTRQVHPLPTRATNIVADAAGTRGGRRAARPLVHGGPSSLLMTYHRGTEAAGEWVGRLVQGHRPEIARTGLCGVAPATLTHYSALIPADLG